MLTLSNESTLDLQEVMANDPAKLQQYKTEIIQKLTGMFGMEPSDDLIS